MWSLKAFMLLMGGWKVRGRKREGGSGVVWCGVLMDLSVFLGFHGRCLGWWMDAFVAFDERTLLRY